MSELETLGNELREARERRELTLREVEQKIHIRAKFLEALERGQVGALPSPVQARGFLRNYARFLGFDTDVVILRWDEAALGGARRRIRRKVAPASPALSPTTEARITQTQPVLGIEASRRRRGRGLGLLLVALILLASIGALLLLGTELGQAVLAGSGDNGVILSPLPRDAASTFELTPTSTLPPTEVPRPTPLPNPNVPLVDAAGDVVIQLEVTARTWLRVTVDDQVRYLGMPAPNTLLQYRGDAINVRASNAYGLRAVVNNRDLGVLGTRGQIFDHTFTLEGLRTPTVDPLLSMPTPGEPLTPADPQ